MRNPWLDVFRLAQLGVEAQTVIALRMAKLALGGAPAKKEARRMVSEKIAAFAEAQRGVVQDIATGKAGQAAGNVVARYRRKVRANRRRLSRG